MTAPARQPPKIIAILLSPATVSVSSGTVPSGLDGGGVAEPSCRQVWQSRRRLSAVAESQQPHLLQSIP